MYIRWQSYRQRRRRRWGSKSPEPGTSWRAILVESTRVDGEPRQRHVAYLGSIHDSVIKDDWRYRFWDDVTARLDALGHRKKITADDRTKIEAALARKVGPRLSLERYKEIARDRARAIGWEWISPAQRAALQDEADQYQDNGGGELGQEINKLLSGERDPCCSFCGKSTKEVQGMLTGSAAGSNVNICDACIEHGVAVIAERKNQ
jgi:hypothetical protein